MSFLAPLMASAAPAAAATAATVAPNAAATGLGKLIGADPTRIASIAHNIGGGMNQIAAAGGGQGAYQDPGLPPVQNHLQLLDPAVLQALIQHFGGGGGGLSGGPTGPGVRSY